MTGRRATDSAAVSTQQNQAPEGASYAKLWKKVEILAPSGQWREAQVVRDHGGAVTVHYIGYSSQFDERMPLETDRMRPYGDLHAARLKEKRGSFVFQGQQGHCPGCGIPMQCENPMGLGYIPPEKFIAPETLKDKPLTAEEEVALLLQEEGVQERDTFVYANRTSQVTYKVIANVFLDIRTEPSIDAEKVGQHLAIGDTFEVSEIRQQPDLRNYLKLADGRGWVFDWTNIRGARWQLVQPMQDASADMRADQQNFQKVCQRCFGLWHYNDCDDIYRPAFGTPAFDELTAESFEAMLRKTLAPATEAAVLAVVDLFDFGNSFKMLEFLAKVLEDKPKVKVHIIANKLDLLSKEVSKPRIRGWVAREANAAGLTKIRMTAVHLVSCHKREGIKAIAKLLEQTEAPPEFYVVGAANAGKSSLLNRLTLRKRKGTGQTAANRANGVMVSPLPGTTIQPMVMRYQAGNIKIIDCPGLLVPGSLADRLTLEDLKLVMPQKDGAQRLTLQMKEGKALFMGGLARLDMVEGLPYQFTVFKSEHVHVHRCDIEKVPGDDYAMKCVEKLIGGPLSPPLTKQRFRDLLPWVRHRFELEGAGWLEACCDIVFHGLGWISLTGSGPFVVEAWAPEGVEVSLREDPLMPYEAKWTGVQYNGFPGWYKVKGKPTSGHDVGNARKGLRGKF